MLDEVDEGNVWIKSTEVGFEVIHGFNEGVGPFIAPEEEKSFQVGF